MCETYLKYNEQTQPSDSQSALKSNKSKVEVSDFCILSKRLKFGTKRREKQTVGNRAGIESNCECLKDDSEVLIHRS